MMIGTHGKEPNRTLMYQKHMPYSKGPTLELAGVQMRTWWSFDGKRHMLDIVHFLVIVNKYTDNNAKTIWRNIKKELGSEKFHTIEEGKFETDIMDIADILDLLYNEHIPYPLKFEDAARFRETIIASLTATLTALENTDTSMMTAAASAPEDAVAAAASIAQEATKTVMNDTESDSD